MATCSGCAVASNNFSEQHKQIQVESERVLDTSLGGYNCSFVEEPDRALVCLICARVLREPELTDCCGNHYCATCLKHWIESSGGNSGCPLCRERRFATLRDKKTERAVQELQVALPLIVVDHTIIML